MTIGELIRHTRKEKGMTQKQVAELCGMADSAIRKYESGSQTPKLKTIQRIAAALGVEWTELVPTEKQSAMIVDSVIEGADLTVTDSDGNIIRQGGGRQWRKMTQAEQYRAGFLRFHSDEDRIAFFYSRLNTDGKLAASKCFYQHLDKDSIKEVADYVEKLSEIPQYQRPAAPQSPPTPQEGKDTTPSPDAPETPPEGK